MNIKKYVSLILKILVSIFLLIFLFRKTDIGQVITIIKSMDILMFILALFLYAISQVVSAYRWSLFLPKADIDMPFSKLVSLFYIGVFFNTFLPTAIGGDVVKTYYLYKFSGKGGNSLASVFLDRFAGFFAMVIIAIVSLAFGYRYVKDTYVPLLIILFAGMFFSTSIFLWNSTLHNWLLKIISRIRLFKINEKLESLYNAIMLYKNEPRVLLKALGVAFIVQLVSILGFYIISKGFGMTVPIGYFLLFVPIAVAISMIPISLSGLGLREGAFVYLFTKVGATDAQAISISLIAFFAVVLLGFIGGIEYIRLGGTEFKIQGSKFKI